MTRATRVRLGRCALWVLGGLLVAGVARVAWRFPWGATRDALLHADQTLLAIAAAVNLTSIFFKGLAWQLLLRPLAPARFRTTQTATLVGCAVDCVSVSGLGDGTRMRLVSTRDGVPQGRALTSLIWTRIAEAIALAVLVLVIPFWLRLQWHARSLQLAACVVAASAVLAPRLPIWTRAAALAPARVRRWISAFPTGGSGGRLVAPVALALASWGAQWTTYHLALRAVGVTVPLAASFTALLAVNIGGLLRLTPANVGIAQASMALALLPFGVPAHAAVGAGLALQAVQVLPVLALGGALGGNAIAWLKLRKPARAPGLVELVTSPPDATAQ